MHLLRHKTLYVNAGIVSNALKLDRWSLPLPVRHKRHLQFLTSAPNFRGLADPPPLTRPSQSPGLSYLVWKRAALKCWAVRLVIGILSAVQVRREDLSSFRAGFCIIASALWVVVRLRYSLMSLFGRRLKADWQHANYKVSSFIAVSSTADWLCVAVHLLSAYTACQWHPACPEPVILFHRSHLLSFHPIPLRRRPI